MSYVAICKNCCWTRTEETEQLAADYASIHSSNTGHTAQVHDSNEAADKYAWLLDLIAD